MTYKNTIRNALMTYGSIFPSEWHVCDHMLCTIGNGWHWQNGQIVSDDYKKKKQVLTIREMLNDDTPRLNEIGQILHFDSHSVNSTLKAEHIANSMRNSLIDNQSAILNYEFGNYFVPKFSVSFKIHKIYPTSEYSLINNIPEDIKPDWIAGIYKFCFFCLENPFLAEDERTITDLNRVKEFLKSNYYKHIPIII